MKYFFISGNVGAKPFSIVVETNTFFRRVDIEEVIKEHGGGGKVVILFYKEMTKQEYEIYARVGSRVSFD